MWISHDIKKICKKQVVYSTVIKHVCDIGFQILHSRHSDVLEEPDDNKIVKI